MCVRGDGMCICMGVRICDVGVVVYSREQSIMLATVYVGLQYGYQHFHVIIPYIIFVVNTIADIRSYGLHIRIG